MRVLILSLVLLVPLSSSSFAMNAGDLYKYCKPFADRAFNAEKNDDLLCLMYFRGVADSGFNLCSKMKSAISTVGEESPLAPGLRAVQDFEGLAKQGDNMHPAIQSFVNEISTKPEKWGFLPIQYVHSALKKLSPCK